MAIRFVDVKPDEDGKAAPVRPARLPEALPASAPTPEPVEVARPAEAGGGEAPLPGLTHAKPEPKPRGRKKPLSATGAGTAAVGGAAPLLEGLLPELQAHAKPTPKPRGRKKAFG